VDVQSYLGLLALISAGRTGDDTEGLRGYWEASEVYRCLQGNQTLADRLGAAIAAGTGAVRTGTRVTRIDILDAAAATITTAAGDTYDVDHVVLAVPAPQWSGITIEPPLPPPSSPWSTGRPSSSSASPTRSTGRAAVSHPARSRTSSGACGTPPTGSSPSAHRTH
jgi:hypothetical protein